MWSPRRQYDVTQQAYFWPCLCQPRFLHVQPISCRPPLVPTPAHASASQPLPLPLGLLCHWVFQSEPLTEQLAQGAPGFRGLCCLWLGQQVLGLWEKVQQWPESRFVSNEGPGSGGEIRTGRKWWAQRVGRGGGGVGRGRGCGGKSQPQPQPAQNPQPGPSSPAHTLLQAHQVPGSPADSPPLPPWWGPAEALGAPPPPPPRLPMVSCGWRLKGLGFAGSTAASARTTLGVVLTSRWPKGAGGAVSDPPHCQGKPEPQAAVALLP